MSTCTDIVVKLLSRFVRAMALTRQNLVLIKSILRTRLPFFETAFIIPFYNSLVICHVSGCCSMQLNLLFVCISFFIDDNGDLYMPHQVIPKNSLCFSQGHFFTIAYKIGTSQARNLARHLKCSSVMLRNLVKVWSLMYGFLRECSEIGINFI